MQFCNSSKCFLNIQKQQNDDKKQLKEERIVSQYSSTLSLHIAAYENAFETVNSDTKNFSDKSSIEKSWKDIKQFFDTTTKV